MPSCLGFRGFQVPICELWLITGSHPLQNCRNNIRKAAGISLVGGMAAFKRSFPAGLWLPSISIPSIFI
jgi:hypothetical protein